jgi:hypothetical protein
MASSLLFFLVLGHIEVNHDIKSLFFFLGLGHIEGSHDIDVISILLSWPRTHIIIIMTSSLFSVFDLSHFIDQNKIFFYSPTCNYERLKVT